MHDKTYEYDTYRDDTKRSQADAFELAVEDGRALRRLDRSFRIEHVTWQALRGGGNVNKATLYGYRVTELASAVEK